jgi:hypothetical protein
VPWSKNLAQWKKNTASMTSTRSQSISYLRSGMILPSFDWQNSYFPPAIRPPLSCDTEIKYKKHQTA